MIVSELFYNLSVGEVSNLAMGNDGDGTIRETDQGKVISYLNSAMGALYKRFVIITKEALIETVDHITEYKLKRQYALSSGSSEPYKYIIDSIGNPFIEDCIRILEVSNALKRKLPLNDPGNPYSVFTPRPMVLQVPNPITRDALSVMYQAKNTPIEFLGLDNDKVLSQEIEIPNFLESALQNYVAYKIYSHFNGQEHQGKAQEYMSLYDNECTEIELNDLVQQSQSESQMKLIERGFV